jgi:radical SAM superfamily enzyme YgiQ (UPF0313 family)
MEAFSQEIDLGPIRPPSEGGSHSLLIRTTRNCPWNNCTFCYAVSYGHRKFELRPVDEIKLDIDTVRRMTEEISDVSAQLGYGGAVNADVFRSIYKNRSGVISSPTFVTVFNWLASGGKTVFLQDADSLIMKTARLVEVLTYLKETFSTIERITTYARAKTALKKSTEELRDLKAAGLSRLHVGLETGDDQLLKKVKKGVTADEHIRSGKKVVSAGIALSLYVMPGLGGLDRSIDHATHTADVLNEIDPGYIRLRPFAPRPGTPLYDDYLRGAIRLLSPHSMLREIGMLTEKLSVTSKLCFDHVRNPSFRSGSDTIPLFHQGYEGYQMPDQKADVLDIVAKGLLLPESAFIKAEDLIRAGL